MTPCPKLSSPSSAEQMELGRQLLARTRRIGSHSQVTCTWDPRDPELIFGLREPGR